MKFHVFVTLTGCFLFASSIKAQTNSTKSKDPAIKKETGRGHYSQAEERPAITPVPTNGQSFQLDENDPYQGRKEEFLSSLTVKELPADFPKYNKSYGVGGYNTIVDKYYMEHQDILKESVKRKIIYLSQQQNQQK